MTPQHDILTSYDRAVRACAVAAVIFIVLTGVCHLCWEDVQLGRIYLFDLDKERNLPTWLSGIAFFLFGTAALAIHQMEIALNRHHGALARLPILWLGVAIGGWLMSLDEMTILHENLFWQEVRTATQEAGGVWVHLTQWQLLGAPFALAAGAFGVVFFANRFLAAPWAARLAAAGVGAWVVAFLLEGVRGALSFAGSHAYRVGMVIEEELEFGGAVLLTGALLVYLRRLIQCACEGETRLSLGAPRLLTRRAVGALVALLLVNAIGAAVVFHYARLQLARDVPLSKLHRQAAAAAATPPSTKPIARADLDASLAAGASYLVHNQKPEGNFIYEYHARRGVVVPGDNQVRQAGALWGMALVHRERPTPATRAALQRGIRFFATHSNEAEGRRWVAYPGDSAGRTGTASLFCLALLDCLEADDLPDDGFRREVDTLLNETAAFLWSLQTAEGLFHSQYRLEDGAGFAAPSPYFDGETLLALVRVARYRADATKQAALLEAAEAMYGRYVTEALEAAPDSALAKGFYQWGSMAFFQLHDAGWPGAEPFAARTIGMAHWILDEHKVLLRRRNTAYAFEGVIVALELARRTGNEASVAKLRAAVAQGLYKLTTWQFGGPRENQYIQKMATRDPIVLGGVMNGPRSPVLRIDVTQHQMHAIILARRYLYTESTAP